jgi:acyl-CoA synthetase (AMP-forming)/AMP-acid ligase II
MVQTLTALISTHPDEALAIGAAQKEWLTYGALRELSEKVRSELNAAGIGPEDRVAIVLPNGAHMATSFITIAQAATTAPLNPNYREEEYEFYLDDLNSKAIVLEHGYDGPALAAARSLSLNILWLHEDPKTAGSFTLKPEGDVKSVSPRDTNQDDVALILHTSGTTSRPKIVPLLQSNLAASAKNIAHSLSLKAEDRCLNVMPLFHIHGLIAAVTSSVAMGASIWCTSGFNAMTFFASMKEAKPTWYTAVPTMHQAILMRASRNEDVISDIPLRFIRSSSASLPAQVMEKLQETFKAPVIEAYGMTEATHQMCCNPMGKQKPGSVGLAAGPEVAIADEENDHLIEGSGEVVISGPNVTPGYESNEDANAKSFFDIDDKRWFRTGDKGNFDEEGYLFLTGRLKEIINRGGEKVSPLEVDGVLMDHPAVAQVVTFALPHPKLGEEVAAAIVLKDGVDASDTDIRAFAAERMADFKVPRKVVILDEIPKGATGKMQRIGMAEKLGLVEAS